MFSNFQVTSCLYEFMGGSFSVTHHHLVNFGSDWSSACEDIKYLTCHLTSQNLAIDGSSNFVSWSSS